MTIRTATPKDAPELLKIYAPYVQNTAISFEYEVPSVEEFAARIEKVLEKYPFLVAVSEGKLVGYVYASPFHGRAAYAWSVETSIYVRKDHHGQGTGRQLYTALENALMRQNILNMYACIAYPETDDEYLTFASVNFHKHMDFKEIGRFHECANKFGRWYGVVWSEKRIGARKENPDPVIPFTDITFATITINNQNE